MTLDSLSQREWIDDADVTELDFDDEPTAVDTRRARLKRDSIFPPPSSRGEVFSLIEQRTQPTLELIDESPIDFGDVLRAPAILPGWDSLPETDPAGHAPHQMSSIAPVALPTTPPPAKAHQVLAAPTAGQRYLVAMGALATIAAAIALWVPANGSATQPDAAVAAVAFERPTPVVAAAEVAPRPLDLAEIRILAREQAPLLASATTEPSEPSIANAPAGAPVVEPAAVEPSAADNTNSVDTAAADTMPPVEPPAPKAPPFDRGAASTAMSSGASQATSCREPGLPSAQARVSVTFAPSGRVAAVNVDGAYAGTNTGSCIGKTFRNLRVEPFDGAAVTVHKTFRF